MFLVPEATLVLFHYLSATFTASAHPPSSSLRSYRILAVVIFGESGSKGSSVLSFLVAVVHQNLVLDHFEAYVASLVPLSLGSIDGLYQSVRGSNHCLWYLTIGLHC